MVFGLQWKVSNIQIILVKKNLILLASVISIFPLNILEIKVMTYSFRLDTTQQVIKSRARLQWRQTKII